MTSAKADLPILDEIGAEFARLVDAEFAQPQHERARLPVPGAPGRRGRGARRVARRASLVLVLLCLVGGVAIAARFGGGGDRPMHTAPALLGQSANGSWRLFAYRDRDRLCVLFAAAGEPAAKCGGEPAANGLRATSAIAGQRFLIGLTGGEVDSVAVRVGGAESVVAAKAVEDAAATAEAGVPAGTRWFVTPVNSAAGGLHRGPAQLTPLDAQGRPTGAAYLDCSLGLVGPACERQVRRWAARAAR
ncbi:MAG TPA: hypothetical protein VF081_12370 [Solirubrobacterales bacterium]